MTFQTHGVIRDYNPTTDTATVELTAAGAIDVWVDGVNVHKSISRGLLGYAMNCVLTMPDAHRICEAVITSVHPPTTESKATSAGTVKKQTGRVLMANTGLQTVTYPQAFTNAPTVVAVADRCNLIVSGVTNTQFQLTPSGSGLPSNVSIYVTWEAEGV